MERCGVNLTGQKVIEWRRTTLKNISLILIMLLLNLFIAILFSIRTLQIDKQNRPIITQNQQAENEINKLMQKINLLKYNGNHLKQSYLKTKEIQYFIQLINNLPLRQGGIEWVHLENKNKPILKMTGKLAQQQAFGALENYLAGQVNLILTIDDFHINENKQVEFSLNVEWQE
ncbi:hypothetical protein [[Haemophilus] ducreyi]|uniref:hypothetical protein n=1 Tax=Haemophilus ducreyi TaxID=730 RepID=UPI0007CDC5B0|nr:hypothetical protein [[Haemophilus] ducreyi]ANF62194.1 hypothetical protein A6037_05455 [[Haemophilus] ducreyi]ANF67134.1 hypothetical protein A6041_00335 [[Haemophilus] ducreyi]ANF68986.1 hypothetical protein A6042_03010 [[Haemophilus] ducreyi]OOS03086.1 hypothetical protein B0190_06205 [[Haemophilus] ducreyi]SEV91092.1 hypothetical protein SAMN02983000_0723 [[Haemophilus] ducreyi]